MSKYCIAGNNNLFHGKFIYFVLVWQSSDVGTEPEIYRVKNSRIPTKKKIIKKKEKEEERN